MNKKRSTIMKQRNALRVKLKRLKAQIRNHNRRVDASFRPREIDSWQRGALMIALDD